MAVVLQRESGAGRHRLPLTGLLPALYDFQAKVSNAGGEAWTEMVFVEVVPNGKLPKPTAADPVLSIRHARTGILVRWYQTGGVPLWQLQKNSSLSPASWLSHGGPVKITLTLCRVLLPGTQRGFFRLTHP